MNWKKHRYHKFKPGDRVTKIRRFSDDKYCKFGGDEDEVPLGTIGTVLDTDLVRNNPPKEEMPYIFVKFPQREWYLDRTEVEIYDATTRTD